MRNISVGVFEHLYITSKLDVYQNIKYNERTLIGPELNKYIAPLLAWKETAKDFPNISGLVGVQRISALGTFGFGPRHTGWALTGIQWLGKNAASISRRSFGLNWGRACRKNRGATSKTIWNISTTISLRPSGKSYSSMLIASMICTIQQFTCLNLQRIETFLTRNIGESATMSSRRMISASQIRTVLP